MAGVSSKDVTKIISTVTKAAVVLGGAAKFIAETKPYGIIHKTHPITFEGRPGNLVWDYILYNELTFEDRETKEKMRLAIKLNDKDMEDLFNRIVEADGSSIVWS